MEGRASQMAQSIKNPPANARDWVLILGSQRTRG